MTFELANPKDNEFVHRSPDGIAPEIFSYFFEDGEIRIRISKYVLSYMDFTLYPGELEKLFRDYKTET